MFNFNQMLRDAKVDIAAASIDGIEFELFTQPGVAEAYDKHEWSVIHHPEIGQIIHAVPPMEETHTTPWEEWFRWKGELVDSDTPTIVSKQKWNRTQSLLNSKARKLAS